jgi:hypothetical protein
VVSAASVGCFFILIGIIFALTPNLFNSILDFFNDIVVVPVPNTSISLPAPSNPGAHTVLYSAIWIYSLVWGILEIVFLATRIIIGSRFDKKVENASNAVFWLGANYLVGQMLNASTTRTIWFAFWAQILILIGVTLIIRAILLAIRFGTQPTA